MSERQFSIKGWNLTKPSIYAGVIIILLLVPLFVESPYYLHIVILTFIYIIGASSLRTIATSGQISLGHAAFMGIGAYTAAILAKHFGWTPWVTIPLGGLAAVVVAVLVGFLFARLRTIYFAMVSLFFGMGILALISVFGKYTGGPPGITGIPPLFAGISKVPYYYFFLGLATLSLLVLHRFEFCRVGMNLKAIAQSYLVASSVGINEARYRVLALAVGCFFVGIAGAGYAHYNLLLSPSPFGLMASIYLFIYMVVGGIGSFVGPIIGTAVLIIIPEIFGALKEFNPLIFAGIMMIVVFLMPQGLVSLYDQAKSWVTERREEKGVSHAS